MCVERFECGRLVTNLAAVYITDVCVISSAELLVSSSMRSPVLGIKYNLTDF